MEKAAGRQADEQETAQSVARQFFSQFPSKHYPPKTDLISAGQTPNGVYYLEAGHVRQYDIDAKNGLELTIHIYEAGSFFPLAWAVSGIENRYFFATMNDAVVRVASKDNVTEFLYQNPTALYYLTQRLLRGIDGLSTRIGQLITGEAKERVLWELLYLAHHFATPKSDGTLVLNHRFTHQNIADLTGLARETVSHILETAASSGLIGFEKHRITIPDPAALRESLIR